ncbi:chemotaxis protein CheW [Veronia nyctiphanis]|uniref:Chemotaxis protein CheW n=1 Tax=Veronia nyctiphanis TaxID=1278244 RepID=A0A4Q0YQS3_9GAMM|nr:chemotaxis protein CheW [Veronia nyctiphanis]RXJ72935.1 chemotaxis protein CheW [Veronia nyctiphanis]
MKNNFSLSSAQAIEDYFDALLDETGGHNVSVVPVDMPEVDPNQQELPLSDGPDDEVDVNALNEQGSLASVAADDLQPEIIETYVPEPKDINPAPILPEAVFKPSAPDLSHVERLLSKVSEVTESELDVETELKVSEPIVEVSADLEQEITAETKALADTEVKVDSDTSDILVEPEIEVESEVVVGVDIETDADESTIQASDIDTQAEPETQAGDHGDTNQPWENVDLGFSFEVLFFECHGVKYAVPLAHLGGILSLGECSHLIGRPDWYIGLQTEKDQKLDIVDLAKWVMPEKITDNCHRDDYSYIVILGDSMWGLACNTLLGTETLDGEQVQWREQAGRRPWLAGLVKEKMCVLIHVEALTDMFNQGIDARALA